MMNTFNKLFILMSCATVALLGACGPAELNNELIKTLDESAMMHEDSGEMGMKEDMPMNATSTDDMAAMPMKKDMDDMPAMKSYMMKDGVMMRMPMGHIFAPARYYNSFRNQTMKMDECGVVRPVPFGFGAYRMMPCR